MQARINNINKPFLQFCKGSVYAPLACLLLVGSLLWVMTGCKDDDDEKAIVVPNMSLYGHEIAIANIFGIPEGVSFNKIKVNVTGVCWEIIEVVEAAYQQGGAVLVLPTVFEPEKLQSVESTESNRCGHWRATSDNPGALVAGLGDIVAYQDDTAVGRIYLTDWVGEGSTADKTYIYYQYADRPFALTGSNSSFYYSAALFRKGWNAYANVRPSSEEAKGGNLCTTSVSDELPLYWRFESWVY